MRGGARRAAGGAALVIRAFFRALVREARRILDASDRMRPSPESLRAAQDLDAYRLRRCAAGCAVIWYGPSQRCRSCDGPAVAVEPGEIGRCPEPEQMPRRRLVIQDEDGRVVEPSGAEPLRRPDFGPRRFDEDDNLEPERGPWTTPTPWLAPPRRLPSVAAERAAAAGLPGSWPTAGPVCLCGGHPVVRGEVRR